MSRKKSLSLPSPAISPELLDSLVRGPVTAENFAELVLSFKKALIERALGGELTHHLGYSRGESKPEQTPNYRNGTSGKTVLTDSGAVRIEVPAAGATLLDIEDPR